MDDIDVEVIKAVDKLYGAQGLPVRPAEICNAVCKKIGIDPYGFEPFIIEGALKEDDNYIVVPGYDGADDFFFSRRGLFNKAQFCIRPTALEIERGILIPGHRFIPFFDRDSEVRLEAGSNPVKIKKIKGQFNLSVLKIYYSLFGPRGTIELIGAENQDNLFAFMEEIKHGEDSKDADVTVSVYNFKDFYTANKIVEGDLLLLSVVDYKKKICTVECLPEERLWQSAKWDSDFAKGLRKNIEAVEQLGVMELMETFLSRAFFLAGHSLLQAPSSLAVNVLKHRNDFYLAASESGAVLIWENDREFDLIDMDDFGDEDFESDEDSMKEEDSELNQLCGIMGFSINDEELAAYMRDELFAGGDDLENVKNRCFDNRLELLFADLREDFDQEILKLWMSVKKEYNIFRDNPQGKIRRKALELFDAHTAWMRKLDARNIIPDRQLEKQMMKIMQVVGPVSGLVIFFNTERKLSQKEVHNYSDMLDMAMGTHAMLIKDINNSLGIK